MEGRAVQRGRAFQPDRRLAGAGSDAERNLRDREANGALRDRPNCDDVSRPQRVFALTKASIRRGSGTTATTT